MIRFSDLKIYLENTDRDYEITKTRERRDSWIRVNGIWTGMTEILHQVRIRNLFGRKGSENQWYIIEPLRGEETCPDPLMMVMYRYSETTKKEDWASKGTSKAGDYLDMEIMRIKNNMK